MTVYDPTALPEIKLFCFITVLPGNLTMHGYRKSCFVWNVAESPADLSGILTVFCAFIIWKSGCVLSGILNFIWKNLVNWKVSYLKFVLR